MCTPLLTIRKSILALSLVLFLIPDSFAQELKVLDFLHSGNDVSGREHQRLDMNDEPCALIKARTGLIGLEFNSNRGIEAVDYRNGEYWIWVSAGTNNLSIYLEDFPLCEYNFPIATRRNEVYKLTIVGIVPVSANMDQLGETFLSFTSEPGDAEVYVNNTFQGMTPLKLSIPAGEYSYRLEKSKYIAVGGSDSIFHGTRNHEHVLDYDYSRKRFFLMPSISFSNPPGGISWESDENPLNISYGFTFGMYGGTGFFISCKGHYKAVEPDLIFNSREMTYTSTADYSGYYFSSTVDYDNVVNNILIAAGITQQLSKKLFVRAGGGYYLRKCYSSADKWSYEDGQSPDQLPDEAWFYMVDESFAGMNLLAGLSINIPKNLLFDLHISGHFEFADDMLFRSTDIGIGVAYIF